MAGEIASTTFSAGPQDKLAVADVYKQTKEGVINSFQDIKTSTGFDILGVLKGTNLSSINQIINSIKSGKIATDATAVLGRLLGSNDKLKTYAKDIEKSIAAGVNIPMNVSKDVTATVNGVTSTVDSGSLSSIKGLAGIVNTVTNGGYNATFTDKGALAGLVGGISSQASKLGLPNVFSSLTTAVNDRNVLTNAVKVMVPDAVKTGDVTLLADIANTAFSKQIKSVYPNFVGDVTKVIGKPASVKTNDYKGLYDKVTGMFTKADPTWNACTRDANSTSMDMSGLDPNNEFMFDMVESKALSQHVEIDEADCYRTDSNSKSHATFEKMTMMTKEFPPVDLQEDLTGKFPYQEINYYPVETFRDVRDPDNKW